MAVKVSSNSGGNDSAAETCVLICLAHSRTHVVMHSLYTNMLQHLLHLQLPIHKSGVYKGSMHVPARPKKFRHGMLGCASEGEEQSQLSRSTLTTSGDDEVLQLGAVLKGFREAAYNSDYAAKVQVQHSQLPEAVQPNEIEIVRLQEAGLRQENQDGAWLV